MNIKQNKGIGLSDAIIAIGIFIIFTGFIISISYNIYLQSNFIKRNEQATNYIIDTFEYAQGLVFEEVSVEKIVDYINNKGENVKAVNSEYVEGAQKQKAYTVFVSITDVKVNYIKQINLTVMYELGGKVKTINMKTLINK